MLSLLFVYLIGICSTANVYADAHSCNAIDLRPALGKSRHQGESGWCFAHTTADLISLKAGVRVSAFDIATTFLLSKADELRHSHDAVVRDYLAAHPEFESRVRAERLDAHAYAPERILKPNGLLDIGGVEDLALVLGNGKGLCRDENLPSDNVSGQSYTDHLLAIEKSYSDLDSASRQSLAQEFSHLKHIENLESRAKAGALQKWVDTRCGNRVAASGWAPAQYSIAKDADALDALDPIERKRRRRNLNRTLNSVLERRQAVAIGFDANEVMIRDEDDHELHADHSSLIASRRPSSRGCEYFLRNSFGEGCDDYLSHLRGRCDKGGLWVTLDELSTLYSAVWID